MALPAEHLRTESQTETNERVLALAPVPAKRNLSVISLLGRLILGGYFFLSGLNHFTQLESMTGYAASKGVPFAAAAVLFSGVLILVGGSMILLGWKPQIGAWLIVLFLLPVTVMMHNFWTVSEPAERMSEMINFMKNFGLIGATLMIATIRRWPLSIEKPKAAVMLRRVA